MALENIQVIPTAGTSPFQPLRQPLEYSGSLDQYHKIDSTPIIGSEFPNLQLTEILDDEEKLRDLAILGLFTTLRTKYLTELISIQSPSEVLLSLGTRKSVLISKSY